MHFALIKASLTSAIKPAYQMWVGLRGDDVIGIDDKMAAKLRWPAEMYSHFKSMIVLYSRFQKFGHAVELVDRKSTLILYTIG